MNVRPDAFRRALRSPQVILSIFALLGAIIAVLLVRPAPVTVEPFELPEIEEQQLMTEEVRLITFDRFNLEIPMRQTLAVPADRTGRARAIVAAVREQLIGESGSWPADLPQPAVFVTDQAGAEVVVVDLAVSETAGFAAGDLERLQLSLQRTLSEAGYAQVVLLTDGEEQLNPPAPAQPD